MRSPTLLLTLVLTGTALVGLEVGSTTRADAGVTVYPVPTSSAGLGDIVTAPNGVMWFVERDAQQVGRITPGGKITEYGVTGSGDYSRAMDLDVGKDGTVWVVYDSGEAVLGFKTDAAGEPTVTRGPYSLGAYPYGGQIRIDQTGVPWITMNFDESGIARVVGDEVIWYDNAPECDDVLGRAADGSMWCGQRDKLVHVNANASGGTTYPLPSDATYPNGLAAGPTGSIWFTRSSRGTIYTSPDDGSVGYLDASSGRARIWSTGSRTAPADLTRGPDGAMWFTNVGAEPGIGHITKTGRGVISKVGDYEPTSLTFAQDGAVWFTDDDNNSIVRVTRDRLRATTVDLGDGQQIVRPGPATPKVPARAVPIRKGRAALALRCPGSSYAGCRGTAVLQSAGPTHRALTRPSAYRLSKGRGKIVGLPFTVRGIRTLPKGKVVRVRLVVWSPGGKVVRTLRVRR